MEPQLNDVQHKVHILKTLGEPISDAVIAHIMLLALPDLYSTLRTILNSTPATTGGLSLSTDIVITYVLTEEKNTKLGSSQVALIAHTKGKEKPQSSKPSDEDKKKIKWGYCKKKGHIKSECRKLKADQAVKEGKSGEKKDSGCHKLHSAISSPILRRFPRSQSELKALKNTFRSIPVTSRSDQYWPRY